MGINSSTYNQNIVGSANDAYVYTTGSALYIGNLTPITHPSSSIYFLLGGGGRANIKAIISSSGVISASGFLGDGKNLTNVTSSFSTIPFSRGTTIVDLVNGVTTTGSYYLWRAPLTCQVTNIYGKKNGTGTPQINARKSGSGGYLYHTSSNLSISTNDQWTSANSIQNTNYSIGDSLEVIITGSGANQITIQVDFIGI
jgi:hypothetical protein